MALADSRTEEERALRDVFPVLENTIHVLITMRKLTRTDCAKAMRLFADQELEGETT